MVQQPSTSDRPDRIDAVTDSFPGSLDEDDLLEDLVEQARVLLRADTAAVLVHDPSSRGMVATAVKGTSAVENGTHISADDRLAQKIATLREPVVVTCDDDLDAAWSRAIDSKATCLLVVPLLTARSVVGVLQVGARTTRQFGEEDVRLLQVVADRIAMATRDRLSPEDRAAALALQRSLLPPRLPELAGLELAARYRTGTGGVGGDWYDVFAHPSGGHCIVIGDVVGRGLPAAVVMGRLRSALRAYALEDDDPADILDRLDRKVQYFEPDMMATVICALVEPTRGQVRLSSAGHPAPLLALPDRRATLLDIPTDLPLGVQLGFERHTTNFELPLDAVLFLYTDGLVESRGAPLDSGLEHVRTIVLADPPEKVCETVVSSLFGAAPVKDDVTFLAARRRVTSNMS